MKSVIQTAIISVLLLSANAQAVPIELSPGDEVYDGTDCGLCGPGLDAILDWLDANVAGFDSDDESYKSDEDGDAFGHDSGPFADLYTTEFSNPVGDPGDALITWNGGDFLENADWLLVKDGNNSPIWYLFDITTWDGMMDIVISDFWPGGGAISHVSVFGGDHTVRVPEPGTLALFGIGLLGMGAAGRRKKT